MSGERAPGAVGAPAVWGCARHAQLGRTCCQDSEILVTEGDRVRIRDHIGHERFWADTWPRDPSYADDGSDPGWTLAFHMDGSRPTLNHQENGDCTFLGERGCVLPQGVRPIVCRLYPYGFDEHRITTVCADRCPPEVVPEGATIVELLEMDPTVGEQWRAQLYAEIRAAPGRGR